MNFKEYVIRTFDMMADLTEGRLAYLNKMLNRYNASRYTKQQFYEEFGLEGIDYFSLLDFLTDEKNEEKIVEFGNKFNTVNEQKSLS